MTHSVRTTRMRARHRDESSLTLPFSNSSRQKIVALHTKNGLRAIEDDSFPFETLSAIAELESWRKEIHRPLNHIHKWWAQRLGTVFRAMVIGAFAPSGADILDLFYRATRIPDAVIFDPFMGSGTTIGEAVKLGTVAVGRDINPVAYFLVKNALSVHDRSAILRLFDMIERDVADDLRRFYRAKLSSGIDVDVLYFFWVMTADCPECATSVDLFTSYIFAQHAYPKKYPDAHVICPQCGELSRIRYDAKTVCCTGCQVVFDPQVAPAKGQKATCPSCCHSFSISKTVRARGKPPQHRLYAKLVLMPDGTKSYLRATHEDRALYSEAERALNERQDAYPMVAIEPGYNTNQALGYHYRFWHEMFNARQLLCLSMLSARVKEIPDPILRDLFACLLSGTLEFNNMFASYKGEGTGAVRHMFAHHILKPERMALEANLWGTPKSSGSFSTMFEGRITRALDYAADPFELRCEVRNGKIVGEKVFGLSEKIGFPLANSYQDCTEGKRVYISCGDSSRTDLPDASVDAVLTDPPFFDNVHYSQLADFFHTWQRHILGASGHREACTTRSEFEVQHSDVKKFTERLRAVLAEAHRVLRLEGLLAFTYHHSRSEGWSSVLQAIMEAGFGITAVHPIKAEMAVAMPKQQAKEPINLDIIVVCRKRSQLQSHRWNGDLWGTVTPAVTKQIARFRMSQRALSRNDIRIIVMAQLLRRLSVSYSTDAALDLLDSNGAEIEALIEHLHDAGGDSSRGDRRVTYNMNEE